MKMACSRLHLQLYGSSWVANWPPSHFLDLSTGRPSSVSNASGPKQIMLFPPAHLLWLQSHCTSIQAVMNGEWTLGSTMTPFLSSFFTVHQSTNSVNVRMMPASPSIPKCQLACLPQLSWEPFHLSSLQSYLTQISTFSYPTPTQSLDHLTVSLKLRSLLKVQISGSHCRDELLIHLQGFGICF